MDTFLAWPAPWFTAPAVFGTGFLLLQLIMGQFGGDLDGDGAVDVDLDDPGAEAKHLSLQTIAAFMVGFGWIGLAVFRFTNIGFLGSAAIALGAGFAIGWMMIQFTKSMLRLQSSANLKLDDLIGITAPVYITVPPKGAGTGRVTVVHNNGQHELEARQLGPEPIATNTTVRIVSVETASDTVVVELA